MPEFSASGASRSTYLVLRDELALVKDGYAFLDEKRILLAAEILRQRDAWRDLGKQFRELMDAASGALADAIECHGLEELQVYPAGDLSGQRLDKRSHLFVGVPLVNASLVTEAEHEAAEAVLPTAEAQFCTESFLALVGVAAGLAAVTVNLHRLIHEYRRTERRTRALENVVMPELRAEIRQIEGILETLDLEEVVRVRFRKPLQ